jgi:hypothetical protein
MRLVGLNIEHFRSIEAAAVNDCDAFNVLIGKNNAGKSSVLLAVDSLFGCLASKGIVNLNPPVGNNVLDFHNRTTEEPIKLTAHFALSLADRDALLRDIVTEFPQMGNAVDGLDPRLQLSVSIAILADPQHASYIRKIALEHPAIINDTAQQHVLLEITEPAAVERISRARSEEEFEFQTNILGRVLASRSSDEGSRRIDEAGRRLRDTARMPLPMISDYLFGEMSLSERQRARRVLERYVGPVREPVRDGEEWTRTLADAFSQAEGKLIDLRGNPLKRTIRTFSGDALDTPKYVGSFLENLTKMKVLHLTERRKQIGRIEASQLLDLKITRGGPEVLRTIQDTVSALMGISIDAFRSEEAGETSAELDVDNFLVQANGSGIREALRVVLDYEFAKPSFLLVEEPEVHLHPALEVAVMRYLKRISADTQVFITTHSTNFLDTAEMRNVYLVGKDEQGTSIERLSVEDAEVEIPRELGIRLSSLFMYDTLVFVEGPSDEAIMRELAAVLSVNLSEANVGFVTLGGVGNFTHYAAEGTLNFLSRRQVRLLFILDRDERDDADVEKLRNRLSDDVLHVLTRRELENYLLIPEAIAALINEKMPSTITPSRVVNREEVQASLSEAADELQQLAIDLRIFRTTCRPVFPRHEGLKPGTEGVLERSATEVERLIAELQERQVVASQLAADYKLEVERRWATEKLHIVPGSTLLNRVFERFGLRYKKERDGARMASMLKESDINVELRELISSMA